MWERSVAEVFRQRGAELDGLLADRWEVFWETLRGNTDPQGITGRLGAAVPALESIVSTLQDDAKAKLVTSLLDQASDQAPTLEELQ